MDTLNTILQIPERSLVNKKITKAFFKRNFDLTSSEKLMLDDVNMVMAIDWLASISPASTNISRYQDEQYLFEEVQVISVQTTEPDFKRNHLKIADLVQKYIPYPVLLCIYHKDAFVLNTCDKRVNQNDNARRTIEKRYSTETVSRKDATLQQQDFMNSLIFTELDKTNLKTYYDSYTQRIVALQAALLSGSFVPRTQSRTQSDMDKLEKIAALQNEIQILQNQTKKESQLSLQISLNTQVQLKRRQIEELKVLISA